MKAVNNSELTAYRDCAYRWGRRYVDKLEPDAPEEFGVMDWGSAYHALQEVLWDTKSLRMAQEAAGAVLPPGQTEALEEINWCLEFYAASAADELASWVVLGTEVRIAVNLGHGLLYYGTIDLLVWDPIHKRIIIVDHKSTGADVAGYEGRISLDTQSAGYTWLVQEALRLGWLKGFPCIEANPAIAFQWHVVRRKLPSTPQVNKDGKVSVRAIDTLPTVYAAALEQQVFSRGITATEDQVALLASLRGREHSWFRVTEHYVSAGEVERWRLEARATVSMARAMERRHSSPLAWP